MCCAGAGQAAPGRSLRKPGTLLTTFHKLGYLGIGPDLKSEQDKCPGANTRCIHARCSSDGCVSQPVTTDWCVYVYL